MQAGVDTHKGWELLIQAECDPVLTHKMSHSGAQTQTSRGSWTGQDGSAEAELGLGGEVWNSRERCRPGIGGAVWGAQDLQTRRGIDWQSYGEVELTLLHP